MLTLTLRSPTDLPLELTGITPAALAGKAAKETEQVEVWHGNRKTCLGELVAVTGSLDSDEKLTLAGDFHSAVGIGAGMKSGFIRVEGNAGDEVGMGMCGGEIEVSGDVGANAGAQMHAGLIRIRGSVGDNVGAALVGSQRGMTGGTILIDGAAGEFVGRRMRRGLIAIRGTAGGYVGHSMLAGSIVVIGACGAHPGAEMSRGTICLAAADPSETLPTFRYACMVHAPMLGMIGRQLQSLGFENDVWSANRRWGQLNGDFLNSGRGEIFVAQH